MGSLLTFPGFLQLGSSVTASACAAVDVAIAGEPAAVREQTFRLDAGYELARLTGRRQPQGEAYASRIAYAVASMPGFDTDPMSSRMEGALRDVFGHKNFQPGQRETVRAVLQGRDTFTIFPTGAGKSLCYQLPAVLLAPDLTVVISPLIALMNDQVGKLTAKGVAAACVHSNMTVAERAEAYEAVRSGKTHLLYVSPEQLGSVKFFQNVGARKVALLAVDEAHCISTWGHDFRPSYQLIRRARLAMGDPPIALITATAPPHTRRDIRGVVGLDGAFENFRTSLRPNLSFAVERVAGEANKFTRLCGLLKEKKAGATIVYASARRTVENLSLRLKAAAIDHVAYHGQMETAAKTAAERAFFDGKSKVIVCTNAFGMGIDKSDIRRIVHYQTPGSIEDYYQQVGRAGRDGNPSQGVLLFDEEDVRIQTGFVIRSNPEASFVKLVYERVKAFALKVPAYQKGRAATHAQLLMNVESQFASDERFQQMAMAAFGMLVEYGHIDVHEEAATFPGPEGKTEITDALVAEKKTRAFRKLDAMLAYARGQGGQGGPGSGDPQEFVRRYLDESTEEILSSLPSTEAEIETNLYAALMAYAGSARQHAMLLSGNGNASAEAKGHPLFRKLVFVGQGELEFQLELMEAKGLVRAERPKGSKAPSLHLTAAGLAKAKALGLSTRPQGQ